MNVMTVSPVTPNPMKQNEEQRVVEEGVDIPRQSDTEVSAELYGEGSPDESPESEPVGDAVAEKESSEDKDEKDEKDGKDEKDERKAAAKPKRKSTPRKAAGTKTLVVLKEGRV